MYIRFTTISFVPHSNGQVVLYDGNQNSVLLDWDEFEQCEMNFHIAPLMQYFCLLYNFAKKTPKPKAEPQKPKNTIAVFSLNDSGMNKVGDVEPVVLNHYLQCVAETTLFNVLTPVLDLTQFSRQKWLEKVLQNPYFQEIGFAMADLLDYIEMALEKALIMEIEIDGPYAFTELGKTTLKKWISHGGYY